MYSTIRNLPSTRQNYANQLIEGGVLSSQEAQQMIDDYRGKLDRGEQVADVAESPVKGEFIVDWTPFAAQSWDTKAETAISSETADRLSARITSVPEEFKLHPRVAKIIQDRRKMAAGEAPMDWGFAENMAYASLIAEGYGLRLVGQDSGRGTFFHRHAIWHDQKSGKTWEPLANLGSDAPVTIVDSLLSEEAVLGFEYGYACSEPNRLVIWEAQFGDFVNGAQVVIDQFITSGETKWGRLCGLVMFLPHGYEGQGPEHSSARLERFLQMCSYNNIQVCTPTTPAQMFHLLRRQMIRRYRKPLIVMTPKSLLRSKSSTSLLERITDGQFQLVIDDPSYSRLTDGKKGPAIRGKIRRVVLCAGKIFHDLAVARDSQEIDDVALVRIEQLYPFPKDRVVEILTRYPAATEIAWCQEEPKNQGAWYPSKHNIEACLGAEHKLFYTGRNASASPAVGYYSVHIEQQRRLVQTALTVGRGQGQRGR
jgi:2-oxoglutarate dehydrogenase E1 component